MGLRRGIALWMLVVVATLNLAACATMGDAPPTLYKRLGGREGIALVVGDFVTNMAGDSRVNARFKDMKGPDVEKLKSNLADQICDATGGPCSYLGRDMKTTHKGMKITDAEWNATVENLTKALDKNKVAPKDQSELLGLLGPMKADIVGQ
jgi:hemoglobin